MATNTETLQPTDMPTSAPTVAPAPEPVKVQTARQAVQPVAGFAEKISRIKASGSVAEKALVQQLEAYVEKMSPGLPVNGDHGANTQYGLFRTLQSVINSGGKEFQSLWNIVLMFFLEHNKGAFGHDYIFRFTEYWVRSQDELNAFLRFGNIASLTADPKTRAHGIKQIDFHRSLQLGVEPEGRQNLLRFYGV